MRKCQKGNPGITVLPPFSCAISSIGKGNNTLDFNFLYRKKPDTLQKCDGPTNQLTVIVSRDLKTDLKSVTYHIVVFGGDAAERL